MIFSFLHHRARNLSAGSTEPHPAIKNHELHHDTTEGAEFIDDAIHIEDLKVTQAEVSAAAGSPDKQL
jgi:hypothetical protein